MHIFQHFNSYWFRAYGIHISACKLSGGGVSLVGPWVVKNGKKEGSKEGSQPFGRIQVDAVHKQGREGRKQGFIAGSMTLIEIIFVILASPC